MYAVAFALCNIAVAVYWELNFTYPGMIEQPKVQNFTWEWWVDLYLNGFILIPTYLEVFLTEHSFFEIKVVNLLIFDAIFVLAYSQFIEYFHTQTHLHAFPFLLEMPSSHVFVFWITLMLMTFVF